MSSDESKLKRTTYLPNYSFNRYFLTNLLKIEDAYSFNILLLARWFIHSLQHFFFSIWIVFAHISKCYSSALTLTVPSSQPVQMNLLSLENDADLTQSGCGPREKQRAPELASQT